MPERVLLEESDGVATVTLDRPERLNAFAGDMRERLADALEECARRPSVRVLVLAGAGRAFCTGGDVAAMAELSARQAPFEALAPAFAASRAVIARLDALPFPTLAAIHGPAAGAGLNLALACDLRLASDQATFAESFVRLGLVPDWGGSHFLPRRVGLARALELAWLGDPIDAAEALRIGLVDRVYPHAGFAAAARDLALRLAAAPAASVRLAKRTLRAGLARTLEESLAAEVEAQAACWATADVAEGLRAFVEKRPPRFGGTGPAAAGPAPSRAARRFE